MNIHEVKMVLKTISEKVRHLNTVKFKLTDIYFFLNILVVQTTSSDQYKY